MDDVHSRSIGAAHGVGLWRMLPASAPTLAASATNTALAVLLSLLTIAATSTMAEETTLLEPPITAADRDHWSFRALLRPALPLVKDEAGWCRTPIDVFILSRLQAEGLEPMPRAGASTLRRRAWFDLVGLPPSAIDHEPVELKQIDRQEAAQGLATLAPVDDNWGGIVDRLLSSPEYGEHWAQHWLDLARYADTDGFEFDTERPNAWRYRDWVIDALNRDLPYDEFLRLQLAGDEIAPGDAGAHIATGFLLSGTDMPDLNLQEERRHNVLNDMAGTAGSVVLGLQLGCAQCHDHKYDPVSQADFYRLRAFFEPAEFFKEHPLPGDAKSLARTMLETLPKPPVSRLMIRGDFRRPGPELSPAFLRIACAQQELVAPPAGEAKSTGGRRQLAEWITRPGHPLTARVIVNRVWQYHFGRGLVGTPSDFGLMGEAPTHPELLDWLAATFSEPVDSGGLGWSLKRLHRLILDSAVWQQASRASEVDWPATLRTTAIERMRLARERDPHNELWSRGERRRLEGEAIRDALWSCSGRLNSRRGGPGVRPPLPAELVATLLKNQWVVSPDAEDHYRRSIYLFARRNLRYPLFEAFDRPDANASCPRRTRSTIAPQALFLLNSELTLAAARELAMLVHSSDSDLARQVDAVWIRALGRSPNLAEQEAAIQFLIQQRQRITVADAEKFALTDLCLAVFNLNEFVYVD